LIATDYSDLLPAEVAGKPFTFTADRPGLYRFAAGQRGDTEFTSTFSSGFTLTRTPYTLTVTGVSNLAVGEIGAGHFVDAVSSGVVTRTATPPGDIYTYGQTDFGINVVNGDLGTVFSTNSIYSDAAGYRVRNGNLRSIESVSMLPTTF